MAYQIIIIFSGESNLCFSPIWRKTGILNKSCLNIIAPGLSWRRWLWGSWVPCYFSSSGINNYHLYRIKRNVSVVITSFLEDRTTKIAPICFDFALTFLIIIEINSSSRFFISPENLVSNSLQDISIFKMKFNKSKTSLPTLIAYSPNFLVSRIRGWLWRHNEGWRNNVRRRG